MFSLKITMLCHSVFSLRSPVALSRQFSDVASEKLTTFSPGIQRPHLRVLAEIADQNDFVDATGHDALPTRRRRRDAHAA